MFTFRKNGHFYEKVGKKGEPVCIDDEIHFDIPDNWEWCRLGFIGDWGAGSTPKRGESKYYNNGTIPWLKTGDLNNGYINEVPEFITEIALKETSVRLNPIGSVLIAMYGATIGKVGILNIEATTNQACCACLPFNGIYNKFLFYYLMSQNKNFNKMGEGGAQPNISRTKIINYLFPIPPLKEQKRIVEKIEEIIPFVNEYGNYKEDLDKLNSEFSNKLKSSILQEAIQGKLIPQDPNDEPASVLLERIKDEKERLIKEKKIKRNKNKSFIYKNNNQFYEKIDNNKPICIDNEIPFEIPNSWEWVRLDTICKYIQRGKSPKYSEIKMYPVVAQKCNQWSGFSLEKAKFIDPKTVDSYKEERILQNKDIMWNSTGLGTLGRVGLYDESVNKYDWAVADSHVTIIRPFAKYVFQEFIYLFLASPTVQLVIESKAGGSTKQKELNLSTIKNYLIPLAPHNEQKRIIDKVFKLNQILG